MTPPASPARPVIEAYGEGGFRVAGERRAGSILIVGTRVLPWTATDMSTLTPADFVAVLAETPRPEIVLLGCGRRAVFVRPELRQHLRNAGAVVDAMDTGAACRTYNVLLAEERRVAALLIAID